nr:endonuclease/exonuclease/phosphatase family protein [Massilia sp. TS11]
MLLLALWLLSAAAQAGDSFVVATYNLRLDTAADGANAWPQRREAVLELVRYHGFDVFGTQEALPQQVSDLEAMGGFGRVGVGRDDGQFKGEHAAIFFRLARFALEQHGDFWLSETPERPSRGWDGRCCNRIASWARLRDRRSGKRFYVFNAHFDHEGRVAQYESAQLMLRKIGAIAGKLPVLFVGDLNSTPDTPQVRLLQAALQDARLQSASPPYGPEGTFQGFHIDDPLRERIDYIFASAGIAVLSYAALTDQRSGRYPSDHLPVVARVRLP